MAIYAKEFSRLMTRNKHYNGDYAKVSMTKLSIQPEIHQGNY